MYLIWGFLVILFECFKVTNYNNKQNLLMFPFISNSILKMSSEYTISHIIVHVVFINEVNLN